MNSPSASDPSTERLAARSAERELRSRFPLERAGAAGSVAASVTSSALASVATAVAFSSLVAS